MLNPRSEQSEPLAVMAMSVHAGNRLTGRPIFSDIKKPDSKSWRMAESGFISSKVVDGLLWTQS